MKYVLEDLMRIRKLREDRAQREVIKKRFNLDSALQLVAETRKELSDYAEWRPRMENRLYEEIEGKTVSLKDLDDLKMRVVLMREREAALEKEVQEAEKAAELAAKELDQAKSDYRVAVKDLRKMEEHKTAWMAERRKEEEQEMDKELEDFRPKSEPDEQEEWGAGDESD